MSGTPFEIYVYKIIRSNYPAQDGWKIYEQPTIDGLRLDFVVSRGKSITVIDAKDKSKLNMKDVYQIDHYGQQCEVRRATIYIANDTQVPASVKDYADRLGVRIIRTQWH